MQKAIISVLIQICFYFMTTAANGYVSLQLYDHYNGESEDYGGSCCDAVRFFGSCLNDCDNFFEIWLKPYPASWSAPTWKSWTTYVLGDDNFDFPGYGRLIGDGLRNPLTYRFSGRWPRSFGIIIKVWDDDSGNFLGIGQNSNLVDQTLYNIVNIDAKKNSSPPVTYSISGRRSTTRVLVRVYCDTNYYGTDCGVICIPRADNTTGHYTCDQNNGNKICRQGWMGHNCLTAICKQGCDPNHGYCTNEPGVCRCRTGWQGGLCSTCKLRDNCSSSGGYCVNGNDCVCRSDWTGINCEKDLNKCRHAPCQNSGTCINSGPDLYKCNCPSNYTGVHCETENDLCRTNSCNNAGTCINYYTYYNCSCIQGYTGNNCQTNIDECQPNKCYNNATCIDGINSYSCNCIPGYTGIHCETEIDECAAASCYNNATCVDGINSYSCNCMSGYTGIHCETEIDECAAASCYNNATCVDGINSYSCNCSTGYTGRYCGERINHCARSNQPCDNGGRCVNELDYYRCLCPEGYNGTKCEITPCDSGPCLHNGTCYRSDHDEMGGSFYNCSCMDGFKGKNCEIKATNHSVYVIIKRLDRSEDSSRTNGSRTSAYFIIGGSVAGTILITIIVALIIWKIKKAQSVATVTQIEIGISNQQSNRSNVSENPALETMS